MPDETSPEAPAALDHARLSDEELIDRLHDNRKGSAVWAAALTELLKRGDQIHDNARFRAALDSADDDGPRPRPVGD
jgi:hypothetical protein